MYLFFLEFPLQGRLNKNSENGSDNFCNDRNNAAKKLNNKINDLHEQSKD